MGAGNPSLAVRYGNQQIFRPVSLTDKAVVFQTIVPGSSPGSGFVDIILLDDDYSTIVRS